MAFFASSLSRSVWTALRALVLVTGVVVLYTALVTGIGAAAFPDSSAGSPLRGEAGRVVGSRLIAQSFSDSSGKPIPRYFQPRPSQAGDNGYDPESSGGSNLGPVNSDLLSEIAQRRAQAAAFNGVSPAEVPADAVTSSASGLDPHITPKYAEIQVRRVARARRLDPSRVQEIVDRCTVRPALGFIGEPTVNVVEVNAELDAQKG